MNNTVTTYWIGLILVGNVWTYTTGSPATFFRWRPTQPDKCCGNTIPVRCVLVNWVGNTGLWDDAGCEGAWSPLDGFICKMPL
ncbi:unnamed protein product [Anisakis simplex]|uniref:C-type lectin domain-containing protein n=1 Tax=Anisakis simplex TaxID=6269 RepID=A0A3P6RZB2_ANISI|nr:unnamed protein product [Anisakis simplex]